MWLDMKCSFMDGHSEYNQVKMAKENKNKTTFIFGWGVYVYNVVPFGWCNASATFQKVVIKTLKAYSKKIMQMFFNDFGVYGNKNLGHDLPCEEIQTLFIG